MTKPLPPSQLKDVETSTIPRNTAQRTEKRTKGLITGWMKNHKRGAPLKITPSAASLKKKKKKKSACKKADTRDAALQGIVGVSTSFSWLGGRGFVMVALGEARRSCYVI